MLKKGPQTLFASFTAPAQRPGAAPAPAASGGFRRLSLPAAPRSWVRLAVAASVLLSACAHQGGGYYRNDGPPARNAVDIDSIPNAVPRYEPLSETGNDPYVAFGKWYVPLTSAAGYDKRGMASWYGRKWQGMRTSSGEKYDMYAMTAAHRTLPLPSYARVTNLANGKSVVVRINDRGPFINNRLIDLSYAAAYKLGIIGSGTGHVEVKAIPTGPVRTAVSASSRSSPAPVEDHSRDADRFYVQYGAFTRPADARSLVRKLQQFGIRFARIQHGDDGYFRVRSGPFSQQATAEHVLRYGAGLGLSMMIVTE